jgi:hypothetical protein
MNEDTPTSWGPSYTETFPQPGNEALGNTHMRTRTADLYRVKAARLCTFNNLNSVGDCLSTRKRSQAGLLTGEITGEEKTARDLNPKVFYSFVDDKPRGRQAVRSQFKTPSREYE